MILKIDFKIVALNGFTLKRCNINFYNNSCNCLYFLLTVLCILFKVASMSCNVHFIFMEAYIYIYIYVYIYKLYINIYYVSYVYVNIHVNIYTYVCCI